MSRRLVGICVLATLGGSLQLVTAAEPNDRRETGYAVYREYSLPRAAYPRVIPGGPRVRVADYPVVERDPLTAQGDPWAIDNNWFGFIDPFPYYGYSPSESEQLYELRKRMVREERERVFNLRDTEQRKERVLTAHERALAAGVGALRAGKFQEAVVSLTLAADLNQGDPACRVHLAQARLALGHYELAGAAIRRGLELQPKLAYLPLNLETYFPDSAQYTGAIDTFSNHVKGRKVSGNEWIALGFFQMQRGDVAAAHRAFRSAEKRLPRVSYIAGLVTVTTPPAPSAAVSIAEKPPTKIRRPAKEVASQP